MRVVWSTVMLLVISGLLASCTAGKDASEESTNTYASEQESESDNPLAGGLRLEEGITLNADGSFRFSEYKDEFTGDKNRERIVFDVWYPMEFAEESEMITKEMLWDRLWEGTEISVKVLEGQPKEQQNQAASDKKEGHTEGTKDKEIVLAEYSFAREHAGNGNLAMVVYEKQRCLMFYSNLMYQGAGTFGYEIWQIMPSGQEPVLLVDRKVNYFEPESGANTPEIIDLAIQIGEELKGYLEGYSTEILVNAAMDREDCYMYGSEEGLLNGVRRQRALDVFMQEVTGSGLELKIADYFYPDGMEPITELPANAEERIRDGEILYMQVAPYNTTAGRLDLDGDGERETIYFDSVDVDRFYGDDGWWYRKDENGEINFYGMKSGYRIRVNNEFYLEPYGANNVEAVLMAFSPDGEQILLAVFDAGPSGDPQTYFYRYDGTSVYPAGMFRDDLRDTTIDENGAIKCRIRSDMLETEFAWQYFYWNGTEIVRRPDEIFYYVTSEEYGYEDSYPVTLLKEITVYEERSEESRAIIMKPQVVTNVASDLKEWILLEGEDGTRGWIRVEGFTTFPSEGDIDSRELFDGLMFAG